MLSEVDSYLGLEFWCQGKPFSESQLLLGGLNKFKLIIDVNYVQSNIRSTIR